MNHNDPSLRNPAYRSLTNQQLTEIDRLCDRFDRELMNGGEPRIETFLAEAPEAAREGLLEELLAMEYECRTRRGETPRQDEYALRFPQQERVLASVFSHDDTSQLLTNDTLSTPVDISSDLENYRLIEELGRGGMGVVWSAEQTQPVRRRVALKLIKPEVMSKDVIARFDKEKQALAMMDHPNIARVFDAGATGDGRPYFVMELVDGLPITQYCDDNKLSVDQRLELFVSVCRAVQHAHHKGIIHRDLKPSNVLVTVVDGEAVPKVIDFGLAKAVAQGLRLSDVTMQTEFGKLVGTVQYMSPEQAELNEVDAEDIDTRTDIYSLGVILYELLTGSTPLDRAALGRTPLLKVLASIREEEPPRPSIRFWSSPHDNRSGAGDSRSVHPARLRQLLKGELDWVVMKALEKDRTRRYQTADEFAQDVSNYLSGETVHARPPSTWYQIRKFAGRNLGLVVAMLAVGMALVAGIVGTSYGLIRANKETELAQDKTREANEARGKAYASEQRARLEQENAKSNEQRARLSEARAKFQLAIARWEAGRARDARDLLHEIDPEFRDTLEWHFCNRRFDGSDFTCYGHRKAIADVAFHPDGKLIATASFDSTIRIWDAHTGREIRILRGGRGSVEHLAFSPDGTRLVSIGSDQIVRLWDVASGRGVPTLRGDRSYLRALAFSPDGKQLVSVSAKGVVKRWETESGRHISTLNLGESVEEVAFSPDGKRFVTCNTSTLVLRDAATGQELARQSKAVRWARSIAFSPDGKRIAVGARDVVTLWDARLTRKLWTSAGTAGDIVALDFSPDGTRIASSGEDRQIHVWDVRSGLELMSLVGHGDAVLSLAFSPDGTRLASAGLDKTLQLWDARTGLQSVSIAAHSKHVCGVAFSHDGKRLASASADRTSKLWNVETGEEVASRPGFFNALSQGTNCVAFSPDDAFIAYGDNDKTVKLIDARTGAVAKSFEGHEDWICSVAFDRDGKRLVSGGRDRTVKVWDIETGEEIVTFERGPRTIKCVAFSPDGKLIASTGEQSTIILWDSQSGRELRSMRGHQYDVANIVFSPDGRRLASSSSDHTVRIWDTRSGAELFQMKGHTAGVSGIAFSPDGRRLVSTSTDRTVKLWDPRSGRELGTLEIGPHVPKCVDFSPDGSRIVVGTNNGTLEFLDVPREHEVATLSGHTAPVLQFSFGKDGKRVYSASKKEKLVWDVPTMTLIPDAEWNPTISSPLSPDGRYLIDADRHHLMLVDLDFKNTPREKAYRAAKARFDPAWHQARAQQATASKNWYAATFHFALLVKHDSDRKSFSDGLLSSYRSLESQFEQAQRNLEPYLPTVVKEALQLCGSSCALPLPE